MSGVANRHHCLLSTSDMVNKPGQIHLLSIPCLGQWVGIAVSHALSRDSNHEKNEGKKNVASRILSDQKNRKRNNAISKKCIANQSEKFRVTILQTEANFKNKYTSLLFDRLITFSFLVSIGVNSTLKMYFYLLLSYIFPINYTKWRLLTAVSYPIIVQIHEIVVWMIRHKVEWLLCLDQGQQTNFQTIGQ